MSLTDTERKALRKRCAVIVSGFRPQTPAAEFAALATWCESNDVDHDHYGEGPLVDTFERKVAALLGKSSAVFMPSGIMAQLCAARIWTERARLPRIGLHPTSHLLAHEQESFAALMRLHAVPVGHRPKPMVAADLEAIAQPLACAIVELPIREVGGLLPTWDELDALKAAARARDMPLHMDGARLWECGPHYARPYAEIADGFSSVYVSLYKGIGGFAGALLLGDDDFIAEARLWRKRMGGTLARLSPMVALAAMRFDERLASMPALHARAVAFAASLKPLPGIRMTPAVPQTNMLHLMLDAPCDALLDARDRLAEETGHWLLGGASPAEVPGWSICEITVGDALLAVDDASLLPLYRRLMDDARSES